MSVWAGYIVVNVRNANSKLLLSNICPKCKIGLALGALPPVSGENLDLKMKPPLIVTFCTFKLKNTKVAMFFLKNIILCLAIMFNNR